MAWSRSALAAWRWPMREQLVSRLKRLQAEPVLPQRLVGFGKTHQGLALGLAVPDPLIAGCGHGPVLRRQFERAPLERLVAVAQEQLRGRPLIRPSLGSRPQTEKQ